MQCMLVAEIRKNHQVCSDSHNLVATAQEMVRENKFFKVKEKLGNGILSHGKLTLIF